jgi:hypothetical protein
MTGIGEIGVDVVTLFAAAAILVRMAAKEIIEQLKK